MNNTSLNNISTISVFNSALDELTVLNQLNIDFSDYNFICFWDSAQLPYSFHKLVSKFIQTTILNVKQIEL